MHRCWRKTRDSWVRGKGQFTLHSCSQRISICIRALNSSSHRGCEGQVMSARGVELVAGELRKPQSFRMGSQPGRACLGGRRTYYTREQTDLTFLHIETLLLPAQHSTIFLRNCIHHPSPKLPRVFPFVPQWFLHVESSPCFCSGV